jgi:hypothetical protein
MSSRTCTAITAISTECGIAFMDPPLVRDAIARNGSEVAAKAREFMNMRHAVVVGYIDLPLRPDSDPSALWLYAAQRGFRAPKRTLNRNPRKIIDAE